MQNGGNRRSWVAGDHLVTQQHDDALLADSGAAESSITGVRIYRRKRRGDG
jgi:hypothetical protein